MRNASLDKKKVVLGLSGGVDSTAAALLLKEKSFEVIGLYFNVHQKDKNKATEGIEKAKKMSKELGIKLHVRDVVEAFESCVINNFKNEYKEGRTPNPCVMCNPNIKFTTLIDVANMENAFYIATGHYARKIFSQEQSCYTIAASPNIKKDQSYMLYRLPVSIVERIVFPLSEMEDKSHTRSFVRENKLSNSDDKDSQEICFIDEELGYNHFLKSEGISFEEGDFVDSKGKVIGKHKGIGSYTIGQRKGLGIALGKPAFVTDIDPINNTVTLGDNEDLFTNKVYIDQCYFPSTDSENLPTHLENLELYGKIRYKAPLSKCKIHRDEKGVFLHFEEKQRAAAPGQSAVVYYKDQVFGGGIIKK